MPKPVKTGTTIAGVVFADGIVLGADTRYVGSSAAHRNALYVRGSSGELRARGRSVVRTLRCIVGRRAPTTRVSSSRFAGGPCCRCHPCTERRTHVKDVCFLSVVVLLCCPLFLGAVQGDVWVHRV